MKITDEVLENLIQLSGLKVKNKKEKELLKKQLSDTLSYVENLEEIDTKNIVPAYFSSEENKNQFFKDGEKNERALSQKEVLALAKESYKGFIKVKRIL